MDTVNVHEAKTHLSQLLERVSRGERITLARAGKPVAELSPVPQDRRLGFVSFHTPESFFEVLPEDEIAFWE